MPEEQRKNMDRELGILSTKVDGMEREVADLKRVTRENMREIFKKIDRYHATALSHLTHCQNEPDIMDCQKRLRTLENEVGGMKRATVAIASFISLLMGAIGLALKWTK